MRAAKIFKIVCVGGAITDRTIEASAAVDRRDDKMPLGAFKDLAGERQSNVVVAPVTRPANEPVAAPAGPAVCADCRHFHCTLCEEGSAARQFSNYWICHCCRELNRRA